MFRAIGLMSGTSMDGVDVALIETDGEDSDRARPFAILPLCRGGSGRCCAARSGTRHRSTIAAPSRASWRKADAMITDRHAEAVEAFLAAGIRSAGRQSISSAFTGRPFCTGPSAASPCRSAMARGSPAKLGIRVAFDFRAADVAQGGQGAPLVPVFHRALAAAAGFAEPVAVINIGGVANLSFIAPGKEPVACDTGPGNALLDDLMHNRLGLAFDQDGAVAAQGKVDQRALDELLAHPFFAAPPPKSLDRNDFSGGPVERLATEDAAATLTAFTAASLASVLPLLPSTPSVAIVCGGGARNKTLMRELADRLPCPVVSAETFGWSSDAMEAQAFAYLAVRRLRNLPITFPTTTGVKSPCPGESWRRRQICGTIAA